MSKERNTLGEAEVISALFWQKKRRGGHLGRGEGRAKLFQRW